MKKGEKKAPEIFFDPRLILTPEEKARLRELLTSPLYVKALRVVAGLRPSSGCALAGSGARDQFSDARASARLSEMRGWDLYQIALFAILNDQPLPRGIVEAAYPDAGRLDHKWGEAPPEAPKK